MGQSKNSKQKNKPDFNSKLGGSFMIPFQTPKLNETKVKVKFLDGVEMRSKISSKFTPKVRRNTT